MRYSNCRFYPSQTHCPRTGGRWSQPARALFTRPPELKPVNTRQRFPMQGQGRARRPFEGAWHDDGGKARSVRYRPMYALDPAVRRVERRLDRRGHRDPGNRRRARLVRGPRLRDRPRRKPFRIMVRVPTATVRPAPSARCTAAAPASLTFIILSAGDGC